ncbi:sugar porter family MFS transporter [Geodermatophilus sp. URMC 65]
MNPLVVRSAIVAALGGLLFGFETAVISGTTEDLERVYDIGGFWLGFTVATALLGTIVGALIAGKPADRYGRKKVLFAIGILFVVGALGTGLVTNLWLFMFFRFIGGIGVGVASVVAPIYTAEVAPPKYRGRLVGLVQFNIVLGILLAYLSNYILASALPSDIAWRWMFMVMAVPAVVFFLLLFTTPETPRWLYMVGRREEAVETIHRLTNSRDEAEFEIREIEQTLANDAESARAPFFVRQNRKVILLAVAIAAFNQLSGINAILYYANDIFRMAGAGDNSAALQSVVVGLVNLVTTMAALTVIDKIGRRRLMLIGSIGYLVSLGALAAVFTIYDGQFTGASSVMVLAALVVFIAAHAFGQGSVIWVFISEIFPNRIRARGQSLGSLTHWVFAAVVSWSFPGIAAALGGGAAFAVFFVCMVGQLVWVLKVMPETKNVPLEEMEQNLGIQLSAEDIAAARSGPRAH